MPPRWYGEIPSVDPLQRLPPTTRLANPSPLPLSICPYSFHVDELFSVYGLINILPCIGFHKRLNDRFLPQRSALRRLRRTKPATCGSGSPQKLEARRCRIFIVPGRLKLSSCCSACPALPIGSAVPLAFFPAGQDAFGVSHY